MGMNPDTNRFEELTPAGQDLRNKLEQLSAARDKAAGLRELSLLRPDGTRVPEHWSVFVVGENVVVKNYTFKVAYIGESTLLLEPVGPVLVGVDHG